MKKTSKMDELTESQFHTVWTEAVGVEGYDKRMFQIGKRRPVASRDSFGQTSAAYRTCRKLVSLNLIKEVQDYGSTSYAKI